MAERRIISTTVHDRDGNTLFAISIDTTPEPEDCSCDKSGIHSLGSVASIRLGETDPECPHHGCG